MIGHQTEFHLMLNQSEIDNHIPNMVWFNKIQKTFLCVEKNIQTKREQEILSLVWRSLGAGENYVSEATVSGQPLQPCDIDTLSTDIMTIYLECED